MQAQLTGVMYTKGFDAKTRSVEAVLSSDTIDGHGEIIDQASWRLARYLQNPVVLHMHRRTDVIGHAQDVRVAGGQLQGRIVFATTKLAEEVATLFRDGAMRAFSVGFRPGRIVEEVLPSGAKIERLLDCELMEVSAVSVPSNPDAVVKYKSIGLLPASYQADASDDLIRTLNERVYGPRPDPASTGDPALDLIRHAEARSEQEGRLFERDNDFDPFDFGGAA